jgi:hypothetical protein
MDRTVNWCTSGCWFTLVPIQFVGHHFYTFSFEIKLHCGKRKPPKASDRKEFLQNYLLEILLSTTTSPSWWAGGCWLVHYVWPLKKSNNKYKVL